MTKILAFTASPFDTNRLRVDKEIKQIKESINDPLIYNFKLEHCAAAYLQQIPIFIAKEKPDIVHFSGHGDKRGRLIFNDLNDDSSPASLDSIENIFKYLSNDIKCVFLNSCYSNEQAKRIAKHIPFVIGNKQPINDEMAILFSRTFYEMLSRQKSIKTSFNIAKSVISTKRDTEPVLLAKNRKDLKLFNPPYLIAWFEQKKDGRLIKNKNNEYSINIDLKNLHNGITEVMLNFKDKTFKKKYRYNNYRVYNNSIDAYTSTYGDVRIRVIYWIENSAYGFKTTLYEALINNYKDKKVNKAIKEAIETIKNN